MKRLAIIFCLMLITINTLPVIAGNFVFADSVPDGYSPAGLNDQVDAFKYYCKSRNLAIEGSVLNAVTSATTKVYQTAVETAGLDINELQNQIYKSTDSNVNNFFFTSLGISAMNRIFAEFLQNNNLAVGDTNVNQVLKSGRWFDDADGNGCWVYETNRSLSGPTTINGYPPYTAEGSAYIFDNNSIKAIFPNSLTKTINLTNNQSFNLIFTSAYNGSYQTVTASNSVNNSKQTLAYWLGNDNNYYGKVCIIYSTSSNDLWFGVMREGGSYTPYLNPWFKINNVSSDNTQVKIVSTVINNNNYEGDTIINNEGDIINPNPNPTPTPIPDPNDNHSTTTDPNNPDDPDNDQNININFPNIDLDLPEIDWSIGDLSNKFPFSIPFDLYNMFSVLNTEPQTPEIKGNIDLGIYQWDIEWDLHQFDDTAELLRNVEFVGFIIGLIFITRSLIKG